MKKDLFLFITVAAALVGCKKFTDETLHGDGFKASTEALSGTTRTELKGPNVLWSHGDVVAVFKGDMTGGLEGRGVGFTLKEGDAGNTTGLFCSEVYADFEGKPCCALYPSSMAGVPSGRKLVVDLPAVQYYVDGTFDTNSFPAVARSDDGKILPFMNLCGLVAVYVNSDREFSKICITTMADEALWGEGTVDMGYTDAPQLVFNGAVTEERKTITLKAKSSDSSSPGSEWLSIAGTVDAGGGSIPGDAVKAVPYYFVVPGGTLSKGFTVTLVRRDGSYMRKQYDSSMYAVKRSSCVQIPAFSFEDESEPEIRTNVINKASYKDLFMDSGLHLTQNREMPNHFWQATAPTYLKATVDNPMVICCNAAFAQKSLRSSSNIRSNTNKGVVKWISIYDEKTELVMSEKVGSLTENVEVTDTAEPVALLAAGD